MCHPNKTFSILNKVTFNLLLLLIVLAIGCKSPQQKSFKEFNKINKSLTTTLKSASINTFVDAFNVIDSRKVNNPVLYSKAFKLFSSIQKTNQLIDSICQLLLLKDNAGNDVSIPAKIFINTNLFIVLQEQVNSTFNACYTGLIDKTKLNELDIAFGTTKEFYKDKSSMKPFFKDVPSVAVVALLKKMNNDLNKAAFVVMSDIETHLK